MKLNPEKMELREAHHLQIDAIVPRPIAFVSTVGKDGVFDIAPFSSFMTLSVKPNIVAFTTAWKRDGQKKRTLRNIEASREFVLNLVTEATAEAMNQSSGNYPDNVDKFKAVGLTPVKADMVKPPMVAESPLTIECRVRQMQEFGELPRRTTLIIADALLFHVKDEFYANGEILAAKLKAVGRLGGNLYCRVSDIFEMKRPSDFQ